MPNSNNLIEQLQHYLDSHELNGSKIAIACSAGIDSMVLLKAMLEVYPADLIYVLHVDHGWRKDSSQSLEFLQDFCKVNNLKLVSYQFGYGELAKKENIARKARYEIFKNECQKHEIHNILLGHNLDDHVETVLFRIFRGTNLKGLEGIPRFRKLDDTIYLHRPLLHVSRVVIQKFAEQRGLEYLEDSTNQDLKYSRNRIRLKIIPEALKINSNLLNNVELLAKIVKQERQFVDKAVTQSLTDLGDLPWDLAKFRNLELIIQRRILEKVFTPNIVFVDSFLKCIAVGGFHRINFKKERYFAIKQKQIWLELE